jgi:hypothetical protein
MKYYIDRNLMGYRREAMLRWPVFVRWLMHVCGLLDLGFKGRSWTFEKKVAGGPIARLDLIMLLPHQIGVLASGQHL